MTSDNVCVLGRVSNLWEKYAFNTNFGPFHTDTVNLAKISCLLLDAGKTGYQIPDETFRKYNDNNLLVTGESVLKRLDEVILQAENGFSTSSNTATNNNSNNRSKQNNNNSSSGRSSSAINTSSTAISSSSAISSSTSNNANTNNNNNNHEWSLDIDMQWKFYEDPFYTDLKAKYLIKWEQHRKSYNQCFLLESKFEAYKTQIKLLRLEFEKDVVEMTKLFSEKYFKTNIPINTISDIKTSFQLFLASLLYEVTYINAKNSIDMGYRGAFTFCWEICEQHLCALKNKAVKEKMNNETGTLTKKVTTCMLI